MTSQGSTAGLRLVITDTSTEKVTVRVRRSLKQAVREALERNYGGLSPVEATGGDIRHGFVELTYEGFRCDPAEFIQAAIEAGAARAVRA